MIASKSIEKISKSNDSSKSKSLDKIKEKNEK